MTDAEMAGWIDVSVTVRHGMPHWPDNPPIVLERVLDTGRGDPCNVSHLAMGVHTGTHMDAPVHFIHGAGGLDEMPLTATMGEARVIEIGDPREITAGELRRHRLQPGERVLFRTLNSPRCWRSDRFVEDFVGLSEQAALLLAETRVRVVGVDYLSVGGYHADGARIHKILLEAGIWIIEGLDLSPVTGGRYEMICLPVKLHGSDGAPARAILRPLSGPGAGDRNELPHRRHRQAGLIRHRARVALDTGTGLVPRGGRAELAGQVYGSQHAGPQGRRR